MLTHLRILNFALLEEIELDFTGGLTFLTGETGAGKSILIDAICRLLGARATQEDVRSGATKCLLEATFDGPLPSPLLRLLTDWHLELDDDRLILRREIYANGKSRSLMNNCSVTLQQLRQLAPHLIDLFGQNEHQTLLDADSQRLLYDGAIGTSAKVSELFRVASEIRAVQAEWKALREREQQRQRNIDLLRYQIREIEDAAITLAEETDLLAKKTLLQNSERVHSLCDSVLHSLLERDGSLIALMRDVERNVLELQKYREEFREFAARLQGWKDELQDLARNTDTLRQNLDFEEGSLDQLEDRLEQFHRLKKKYGPAVTDVLAHLDTCRTDLDQYLNSEAREEELLHGVASLIGRYGSLSAALSADRLAAKKDFERNVERELKQVAMEKCRFQVELRPTEFPANQDPMTRSYPPFGLESVSFQIEPNAGEGFRDLNRIASGGELSRLMLALKVVSQSQAGAATLIFDEIDAGIGGKVAYQIGERLKKLSTLAQVLCVTHLPQVAAFGDQHFRVSKIARGERTIAVVEELDNPDRIRELARMLSGSEITDTALQHARELREQVDARAV